MNCLCGVNKTENERAPVSKVLEGATWEKVNDMFMWANSVLPGQLINGDEYKKEPFSVTVIVTAHRRIFKSYNYYWEVKRLAHSICVIVLGL